MPRGKEAQERHNELRRNKTSLSKQAIFVMEYIRTVYPRIYDEASGFYNSLKAKYPDKNDIRKTNEYKSFKKSFTKESASVEQIYFDVQTGTVMVGQPESSQTLETIQTSHISPLESSQTPEAHSPPPDPSRFETTMTTRPETIQTSHISPRESSQTPEAHSPPPEPSRFETIMTTRSPSPETHQKELEPHLRIPLMSRQETFRCYNRATSAVGPQPGYFHRDDRRDHRAIKPRPRSKSYI